MIEQHENLKEYLLNFLPKTTGFFLRCKKSPRYERIKKILSEEGTIRYVSFVVYFAKDFEIFLKKIQTVPPLVYIYTEMENLLWNTMSKFIRSKYLYNLQNGNKAKVSATELLFIDVNDKKYFKSLKSLDIGRKAKSMFAASGVLDMCEEEKEFRQNCLPSYINTVAHMTTKLPFNTFLKNCSYIHPLKPNETNALGGISNLILQVSNALNNMLPNVFPTADNVLLSEDVCDKIRSEWRLYQTEIIPEDAYLNEKVVSPIKTRRKVSYWKKAFVIAGITEVGNINEAKSCDIEKFVLYLEKDCTSNDGKMKYPFLVCLLKLILSLSHGNSAPENGFSINKLLLEIHSSSLKKETIEAIRIVTVFSNMSQY